MVRRAGSVVVVVVGVACGGLVAAGCHSGDDDRTPSTSAGATDTAATGTAFFASGFEGSTQVTTTGQIQTDDIAGADPTVAAPSDWGRDLDDRPEIGAFVIAYDGGNTGDRVARVIDDPSSVAPLDTSLPAPRSRILRYRLASANVLDPTGLPLEGRIQGTLQDLVGVRDLYEQHRVRLVTDLASVTSFAGAIGAPRPDGSDSGIVLYEAWNGPQGAAGPQAFRVVVDLIKAPGASSPLRLRARGQTRDSSTLRYATVWSQESTTGSALPGRWVTFESYIADGRADSGRFWLRLTPEGGAPETVFDVVNTTVAPDDAALDGFADIELLTLEAPADLLGTQLTGQALIVDFDDLVLYSGRRPAGVPAPIDVGSGLGTTAQNPTVPQLPPSQVPAPGGAPPAPPGTPPLPNTTPPTPPGPPAPTGGIVPVPSGPPALPPPAVPSPNQTPTG